jgi:hypothetical protein
MKTSKYHLEVYKLDSEIRFAKHNFSAIILVSENQEPGLLPTREIEYCEVKRNGRLFVSRKREKGRYTGNDVIAEVSGGYILYDLKV